MRSDAPFDVNSSPGTSPSSTGSYPRNVQHFSVRPLMYAFCFAVAACDLARLRLTSCNRCMTASPSALVMITSMSTTSRVCCCNSRINHFSSCLSVTGNLPHFAFGVLHERSFSGTSLRTASSARPMASSSSWGRLHRRCWEGGCAVVSVQVGIYKGGWIGAWIVGGNCRSGLKGN